MKLAVVLGDQLSLGLASLQGLDPQRDVIWMAEVSQEAKVVPHHRQKLVLIFSAMRHFAEELRQAGWTVVYTPLEQGAPDLITPLSETVRHLKPASIWLTEPSEYRVLQEVLGWQAHLGVEVHVLEDDRFLASRSFNARWLTLKPKGRMEAYYRHLRQRMGWLMDGNKPQGGRWNFDADNRQSLPSDVSVPPPLWFQPDAITQAVLALVRERFTDHFGDLDDFGYAVTADEARQVLARFIAERLPNFGRYQDAMRGGDPWLFHSHISAYLNLGLLTAREVLEAAEAAFQEGQVPLASVEGFGRQVLGWREYVRALYWQYMPTYVTENFLNAHRPLPAFFWSAETSMHCLRQAVSATKRYAYAHHIQRLMIIGNFALLAGLDPAEVNHWFWVVYIDAFEWVELPNVTGMALFADGGRLASKPYAASGAYINRMSDYCKDCPYNVRQKTEETACPFNALYWDFVARHRSLLANNPRVSMMVKTWDRMDDDQKQAIRARAQSILLQLEQGAL